MCSGDELELKEGMSTEGYLIDTGIFILFVWRILCLFMVCFALAAVLCIACLVDAGRQNNENRVADYFCLRFATCQGDCELFTSYLGIFLFIAGAMLVFCTIVILHDLTIIFY